MSFGKAAEGVGEDGWGFGGGGVPGDRSTNNKDHRFSFELCDLQYEAGVHMVGSSMSR